MDEDLEVWGCLGVWPSRDAAQRRLEGTWDLESSSWGSWDPHEGPWGSPTHASRNQNPVDWDLGSHGERLRAVLGM